jgi:hypothetical protein
MVEKKYTALFEELEKFKEPAPQMIESPLSEPKGKKLSSHSGSQTNQLE